MCRDGIAAASPGAAGCMSVSPLVLLPRSNRRAARLAAPAAYPSGVHSIALLAASV